MPLFTLEVAGRPVLAFAAPDTDAAADFCEDEFLRNELATLRTPEGVPPWDGRAAMTFRDATTEEAAAWEADIGRAIQAGEINSRDGALRYGFFVFLVPYGEP